MSSTQLSGVSTQAVLLPSSSSYELSFRSENLKRLTAATAESKRRLELSFCSEHLKHLNAVTADSRRRLAEKNEVTGPTAATKSHHHEGGKATPSASASASPSSKKKGKQKQSVEEEENKEVLSGLGRPRSMSDPNLSVRLDGYGLCHDEDTYLRTYIL